MEPAPLLCCIIFLQPMDKMLQVPAIDIRERISDEVIDQLVREIVLRFKPLKIILFGSYAYGSPRPESDVDLLTVGAITTYKIVRHLEFWPERQPLPNGLLTRPNILYGGVESG